jgi:excinuclease ABC subunit A
VLYVLDEPSIGLHQRDNDALLETLKRLRDIGNTVIVVEHDEDAILTADYVSTSAPAPASMAARSSPGHARRDHGQSGSLTGKYLSGEQIPVPAETPPRPKKGRAQGRRRARQQPEERHGEIPLGLFTCVTGVSGGGKSTLLIDTLYKAARAQAEQRREHPRPARPHRGARASRQGHRHRPVADRPHAALQPRDLYRRLHADPRLVRRPAGSQGARLRPGRFSFNVKGGRCEACQGDGVIKIEMHFLPDVYVTCDVCKGKRYNRETLEVKFKGKSIADVLDMTVEEGAEFFKAVPAIRDKLETLQRVGLGYIQVGQQATTLSGGEAQRVKLPRNCRARHRPHALHSRRADHGPAFPRRAKLLEVLHELVDQGNTVVVIEHNLEVIKTADWIIDLGPEGGDGGGDSAPAFSTSVSNKSACRTAFRSINVD